MSRGSRLKAGIKDQKHLLGLKKRPASYLDTALLLFLAATGSQPSSSEREAPLRCSHVITAGVKRINQGGEVGWVLAGEDFWGRETG